MIASFEVGHVDFEPTRQALTFRTLGVEDEGFGAVARPALLDLDQAGSSDVRESELAGNVGDIPE